MVYRLLADREKKLFQELEDRANTPNGRGVIRLVEVLREALKDPLISQSGAARETTELMLVYVEDALFASSADGVLRPLFKVKESLEQSVRAKRPRNRGCTPYSAKAFVSAVKLESKKRKPHIAWAWLNGRADSIVGGFEVVSAGPAEVRFKHAETERPGTIKEKTFNRYW